MDTSISISTRADFEAYKTTTNQYKNIRAYLDPSFVISLWICVKAWPFTLSQFPVPIQLLSHPLSLSLQQQPQSPLPASSLSPLQHPRLIVHNPNILNNPIQALHKSQMRRVLRQIVFPILLIVKVTHKTMRKSALFPIHQHVSLSPIYAIVCEGRGRRREVTT